MFSHHFEHYGRVRYEQVRTDRAGSPAPTPPTATPFLRPPRCGRSIPSGCGRRTPGPRRVGRGRTKSSVPLAVLSGRRPGRGPRRGAMSWTRSIRDGARYRTPDGSATTASSTTTSRPAEPSRRPRAGDVVVQGQDLGRWVTAQRFGWEQFLPVQRWILENTPRSHAGARRLCGAACLLSAPRLAAPGGTSATAGGMQTGVPSAGTARRSCAQDRALPGRLTYLPVPRPPCRANGRRGSSAGDRYLPSSPGGCLSAEQRYSSRSRRSFHSSVSPPLGVYLMPPVVTQGPSSSHYEGQRACRARPESSSKPAPGRVLRHIAAEKRPVHVAEHVVAVNEGSCRSRRDRYRRIHRPPGPIGPSGARPPMGSLRCIARRGCARRGTW